MNLMMLLEMAASGFGERVALGSRDGTGLTYEQLFDRAGRSARVFAEASIERVSLVDVSSSALPIALFGSAWAGKPFVPLNYRLTAEELRRLAVEVAPSITVCEAPVVPKLFDLDGVEAVTRDDFFARIEATERTDTEWDMDPEAIA